MRTVTVRLTEAEVLKLIRLLRDGSEVDPQLWDKMLDARFQLDDSVID